jgi:hypothetical protein
MNSLSNLKQKKLKLQNMGHEDVEKSLVSS